MYEKFLEKQIHKTLNGVGKYEDEKIMDFSYDETNSTISIIATTHKSNLASKLPIYYYQEIDKLLQRKQYRTKQAGFEKVAVRVDYLKKLLIEKEINLATVIDRNKNLLLGLDRVNIERMKREINMLSLVYAEGLKNLEGARYIRDATKETLTAINTPREPLEPEASPLLTVGVVSFLISSILVWGLLLLKKLYSMYIEEKWKILSNNTI